MQFLMLIAIPVSALATFLSSQQIGWLPSFCKFLPEVFSLIAAAFVGIRGVHQAFRFVDAKYLIVFGTLLLVVVCGVLVNQVPPGPILAGMRYFLRAIPFFFVPAVFEFTDRQLKQLMGLILGLAFLQIPIACLQRYRLATTGHTSGDNVFGTLMQSGDLSIFLICVLAVAVAMVVRGRLSRFRFLVLFFSFLIPMSINETKITVFALPLVLLANVIIGADRGRRLAVTGYALVLLVGAGFIFVPVYDFFNSWNNSDVNHQERIED